MYISLVDSTYAPVQRPHCPLQLCSCRRLLQHFHWHCRCSVQSPLRLESLVANHSRIYCRSSTHVCHYCLPLRRTLCPAVARHAVVNDWPHPEGICQSCQCSQLQGNRCCCCRHCRRCCCCHCPAVALDSAWAALSAAPVSVPSGSGRTIESFHCGNSVKFSFSNLIILFTLHSLVQIWVAIKLSVQIKAYIVAPAAATWEGKGGNWG